MMWLLTAAKMYMLNFMHMHMPPLLAPVQHGGWAQNATPKAQGAGDSKRRPPVSFLKIAFVTWVAPAPCAGHFLDQTPNISCARRPNQCVLGYLTNLRTWSQNKELLETCDQRKWSSSYLYIQYIACTHLQQVCYVASIVTGSQYLLTTTDFRSTLAVASLGQWIVVCGPLPRPAAALEWR